MYQGKLSDWHWWVMVRMEEESNAERAGHMHELGEGKVDMLGARLGDMCVGMQNWGECQGNRLRARQSLQGEAFWDWKGERGGGRQPEE